MATTMTLTVPPVGLPIRWGVRGSLHVYLIKANYIQNNSRLSTGHSARSHLIGKYRLSQDSLTHLSPTEPIKPMPAPEPWTKDPP